MEATKLRKDSEPHEPNGDRYIRVNEGSLTFIVKEKDKEFTSFLSVCTFHAMSPDKERAIEAVLLELNQ